MKNLPSDNNLPINIDLPLANRLSGLRQYALEPFVRILFAGESLLLLLGISREELVGSQRDLYSLRVHPDDIGRYNRLIAGLLSGEASLCAEYRLLKSDGSSVYVRDSAVCERLPNGELIGTSVLTDITDIKMENRTLSMLGDAIPCGLLNYTCEKQPRITYINDGMIKLLRFGRHEKAELDYLEMYKSNIFLMVPMEERQRFSKYLSRVMSSDSPIAGEMTLLRCDGTRAHVFGWVAKRVGENGEQEFQSVCMDITDRYRSRREAENGRYIKALAEVYDKIFEFNLDTNTLKCLYSDQSSPFKSFEGIAMLMDDAIDRWLLGSVKADDQKSVDEFFRAFREKRLYQRDAKPPQIAYHAKSRDGSFRQYTGVFIKADESVSYFCCRKSQTPIGTETRPDGDILKEGVRDLVTGFSDGIAAFEITPGGLVKPLFAGENVCELFGYTSEEWLPLTKSYTPVESFVSRSEASYEDFLMLLKNGEAEFTYFDYRTETRRKIKAVCSQRETSAASSRYVLLYALHSLSEGSSGREEREEHHVFIRTFGYFDVFVDDIPIAFRNKKSKELLALLVDRRGGYITSEEAISFLWEDEPVSPMTLSRYRKVALRLKNTLEEYGIPDIVEAVDGKRRLVASRVRCDLYDYLSGKEEYSQSFKGSYLTNYSWGETTLGELAGKEM